MISLGKNLISSFCILFPLVLSCVVIEIHSWMRGLTHFLFRNVYSQHTKCHHHIYHGDQERLFVGSGTITRLDRVAFL